MVTPVTLVTVQKVAVHYVCVNRPRMDVWMRPRTEPSVRFRNLDEDWYLVRLGSGPKRSGTEL